MKTKETLFSIIGSKYAKTLGYEHLVGAYGVIIQEMKALNRVLVISAKDPKLVGQEEDIHKEDLKIERNISENIYVVLVDNHNQEIIYTKDRELITYFLQRSGGRFFTKYPIVHELSEVIDILAVAHPNPDVCFRIYDLDNQHKNEKYAPIVEGYRQAKRPRISLTEELKAQMAKDKPPTVRQLNEKWRSLESYGLDKDEDDYDSFGQYWQG